MTQLMLAYPPFIYFFSFYRDFVFCMFWLELGSIFLWTIEIFGLRRWGSILYENNVCWSNSYNIVMDEEILQNLILGFRTPIQI